MQTENGEGSADSASHDGNDRRDYQQSGTDAGWKFVADNTIEEPAASEQHPTATAAPHHETIAWTASEYVAHHKSSLWFVGLGLAVAALALITYVVTGEVITAVVTVVIGLSFGIFGARPPQVRQYALDEKGLHIGEKLYAYERIRSFSVLQEGPLHSILLTPLQRFMPPISVYYDHADEDKILNVISNYIPHEEQNPDIVDRLMSRIRF